MRSNDYISGFSLHSNIYIHIFFLQPRVKRRFAAIFRNLLTLSVFFYAVFY